VLGRASTAEEAAYLEGNAHRFGQSAPRPPRAPTIGGNGCPWISP
jgi:hypothetical protein